MRTLSLLCVLLLAKLAMVIGRPVPLSLWTPLAYFWQDVLLVILFAALDGLSQRRSSFGWAVWLVYGLIVAYVALNTAVARELSTPLTWPMLRAAEGTLADSIVHHATALNMVLVLLVLAAGAVFPWLFRSVKLKHLRWGALAAAPIVLLGPLAANRVETLGLHRNAVAALLTTRIPLVAAEPAPQIQPESLGQRVLSQELSAFRGVARDRHVLLVILESAAAQYLRPYGAEEDPMPHLTRLAGRGVLFEHAYTVYPESIKGLIALLCSRFPAMETSPEQYESLTTPSLAAVLGEHRYRTALFHSGRFRYLGMESIIRNRGFDVLEDAGHIGGNHQSSFGVDERSTVQRLLHWVDGLPGNQRFFAVWMPIAGHHPYETPEPGPYPDNEEIDRYRNALHDADRSLGALLKGLQKRGLDRRTLVVIIGDHGQAFGQHPGNFGHTLFLYEENVRVPFIIAAPEAINEPLRIKQVVSHVDVAPTVLDLLGLAAPDDYQGHSLLRQRDNIALFFTDYSLGLLGLRDRRWKYLYELGADRSKLFDLDADPSEQRNIAARHPDRVSRYRTYLRRWAAAQKGLLK